ncbi:MAG: transglutaminase family protein, partial [Planctomycetota bacterium]
PARYRISHRTEYRYTAAVAVCQNQLRMQPTVTPTVLVNSSEIKIAPEPDSMTSHVDYFGNHVFTFSIEALHESLTVDVQSDVTVRPTRGAPTDRGLTWRDLVNKLKQPVQNHLLFAAEYCFASPKIRWNDAIRQYALTSFEKEDSLATAALNLTKRIQDDFQYDGSATRVDTPVEESFALKAGVCQDFAQIQVACLRSIGLPARYVSGYIRTTPPPGQERLIGADESHAWVSLYAGPEIGWLEYDPTNGCLTNRDHIAICMGRDYLDVSPMRGVAVGGGSPTLKVSVDVEEIPLES